MRYDIQLLEDNQIHGTIHTEFTTREQCQKFIDERIIPSDDCEAVFSENIQAITVEKEAVLKVLFEANADTLDGLFWPLVERLYLDVNRLETEEERALFMSLENIRSKVNEAQAVEEVC